MATVFEYPAQFDRDIRGGNLASKLAKDSKMKWSQGVRHKPGTAYWRDQTPSESMKGRPIPKYSDHGHRSSKTHNNTVKTAHGNWQQRNGRPRGKFGGQDEIADASRSVGDLLVSAAVERSLSMSDVLYSYDRSVTPGRPVALELFVVQGKGKDARATERLVEKEYEVLDANGEAVKGRKARRALRKEANNAVNDPKPAAESSDLDDEDFEMV